MLDLFRAVSLLLTSMGTLYYVFSTCALARHFRKQRVKHQPGPEPSVSILKPVAGLDAGARENFESYLHQDYPCCQVLFGVLDSDDPALPVLESLASSSGRASYYTGSDIPGSNNKVRILHNLAEHAQGDILVITDADTRVSPDFLRRITAPFADPDTGLVTCLYKGIHPRSLPDALESLYMTCIWTPSVASAEALSGISFGLGAAIAIRRSTLEKIGGFKSIADFLADDFHLGRKAYRLGWEVVLSDYVIDIVLSGASLHELLAREVRWSRTTRAGNSSGYVGYGVTFGFAWAVIYSLLCGFSLPSLAFVLGVGLVRAVTAGQCARIAGDKGFWQRLLLLPLRDLLSLGTWISGLFSDTIQWRGRRLRLLKNGRMVSIKGNEKH